MTLLISALAALTAIVALATKIVEYKSTRVKQKSDQAAPMPEVTISAASHRSSSFVWFIFYAVVRWICFIFIVQKIVSAGRDKPATLGDVAFIGLCVACMILFDWKWNR